MIIAMILFIFGRSGGIRTLIGFRHGFGDRYIPVCHAPMAPAVVLEPTYSAFQTGALPYMLNRRKLLTALLLISEQPTYHHQRQLLYYFLAEHKSIHRVSNHSNPSRILSYTVMLGMPAL